MVEEDVAPMPAMPATEPRRSTTMGESKIASTHQEEEKDDDDNDDRDVRTVSIHPD